MTFTLSIVKRVMLIHVTDLLILELSSVSHCPRRQMEFAHLSHGIVDAQTFHDTEHHLLRRIGVTRPTAPEQTSKWTLSRDFYINMCERKENPIIRAVNVLTYALYRHRVSSRLI